MYIFFIPKLDIRISFTDLRLKMFLYPLLDYCISVKYNGWDQELAYQIELYGDGVALQCRHPLPFSLIRQGSFKFK